MKAQKNTKIMVTCALLVALQVILARFLSINTTFVVVNFSFLAVALSGILFGPLWALAVGAVSDLIGATLFLPFIIIGNILLYTIPRPSARDWGIKKAASRSLPL